MLYRTGIGWRLWLKCRHTKGASQGDCPPTPVPPCICYKRCTVKCHDDINWLTTLAFCADCVRNNPGQERRISIVLYKLNDDASDKCCLFYHYVSRMRLWQLVTPNWSRNRVDSTYSWMQTKTNQMKTDHHRMQTSLNFFNSFSVLVPNVCNVYFLVFSGEWVEFNDTI